VHTKVCTVFIVHPEQVFWCLNKQKFQCSCFYFGLILAEEMIYDDVENGDDGGNSSLEYGWSSSEFESYEEQSDSECKNGFPSSFLRGNHKRHVCMLQCCSVLEDMLIFFTFSPVFCFSSIQFQMPTASF